MLEAALQSTRGSMLRSTLAKYLRQTCQCTNPKAARSPVGGHKHDGRQRGLPAPHQLLHTLRHQPGAHGVPEERVGRPLPALSVRARCGFVGCVALCVARAGLKSEQRGTEQIRAGRARVCWPCHHKAPCKLHACSQNTPEGRQQGVHHRHRQCAQVGVARLRHARTTTRELDRQHLLWFGYEWVWVWVGEGERCCWRHAHNTQSRILTALPCPIHVSPCMRPQASMR